MGNNERSFGKTKYIKNDFLKRMVIKEIEIFNQNKIQEQPFRSVLRKRGSEILQQIYRRTPMSKCDFNKIAKQHCNCKEIKLRHGCSPANLLCIFSTPFTFGGLLLRMMCLSSKFLLITCQSVPLYYMKV